MGPPGPDGEGFGDERGFPFLAFCAIIHPVVWLILLFDSFNPTSAGASGHFGAKRHFKPRSGDFTP